MTVGIRLFLALGLLASPATAPSQERDLAERVEPFGLRRHYEFAHGQLKLPDLRTRVGEWHGVRLLCLNERRPSYAITFTRTSAESFAFHWKKIELKGVWTGTATGKGKATPEIAATLTAILESTSFKEMPTETQPVSVGWPYVYLIESVRDGTYQALIRESPGVEWKARELEQFNRLAREMVIAAGLESEQIQLPPEPVEAPAGQ